LGHKIARNYVLSAHYDQGDIVGREYIIKVLKSFLINF
jgi:hypothetical protein